jgi:hypothetical protein
MQTTTEQEGFPIHFTSQLGDNDLLRGHAYFFAVADYRLYPRSSALMYHLSRRCFEPESWPDLIKRSMWHVLAIGQAPSYLAENREGLWNQWPRIPLPMIQAKDEEEKEEAKHLLLDSAELGQTLSGLMDVAEPVAGVTKGDLRREIASVGELRGIRGSPDDLAVTAAWGTRQAIRGYVRMSHGRLIVRPYTLRERQERIAGALALGLHPGAAYAAWGDDTRDIYLNDHVYWENIPARIWEHTIGGYPVLKKWLSYRCLTTLNRALRPDEAAYFTQTARRLAAIRLLESRLNRNYALNRDAALTLSTGNFFCPEPPLR